MSQNGWTDDFIGSEWFAKSFIPQATVQNKSGKPILLILDSHGSHETCEIIRLTEANNIIILCLPPHTTHKLQPLDVGVFGPFQRAWLERCDYITELTGTEMPKEDFVKEYMCVRQETFRPSTVTSAFRKSGTWPIDKTVFTDDDFVTDAHILSYFSVFYTDLFDEVFMFESLSLDMIRWLVTCCHHVHS